MHTLSLEPPDGADISFLWPEQSRSHEKWGAIYIRLQLLEGTNTEVSGLVEMWEQEERLQTALTNALNRDLSDATRWTDFGGEAMRLYDKQVQEMKYLFPFEVFGWQHSIRSKSLKTSDFDYSHLWEIRSELKKCSKDLKEMCLALGTKEELKQKFRVVLESLRTKMNERAEKERLATRLKEIASEGGGPRRAAKALYDLENLLRLPVSTFKNDAPPLRPQLRAIPMEEQWISRDPRTIRDLLTKLYRRIEEISHEINDATYEFHGLFDALDIVLEIQSRRIKLEEALEEALQQSDALMDTLSRFVLWLLEVLFRTLQSLGKFFEFPDRRRPPCTTMPWNIWPALIILWGVCWMFYSPEAPNYELESEIQISWSEGHVSNAFDNFNWDANFFLPASYAMSQTFLELEDSQASWKDSNAPMNSEWHPHYVANQEPRDTSRTQSAQSTASMPLASIIAGLANPFSQSLETELIPSSASEVRVSIERPHTPHSMADTNPGQAIASDSSVESGRDVLSDGRADAPGLRPLPLDVQTPSRNSEGKIMCTFSKCERFSFEQPDEWRQHIYSHHRCTVAGCKHTELFTAKGQLDRHRRSVHNIGRKPLHYCDRLGCNRGLGGTGFVRRDHMLQHAKHHQHDAASGMIVNMHGTNGAGVPLTSLIDSSVRSVQNVQPGTCSDLYGLDREYESRSRSPFVGPSTRAAPNSSANNQLSHLQHGTEELSIGHSTSILPSFQGANLAGEMQSIHKRYRTSEPEVGETSIMKKLKLNNDALMSENEKLKAEVARLKGLIKRMADAL